MIKLNNTFGNLTTEQFSLEVLVFLKGSRQTTSPEPIEQGIKALSIMFLGLQDKNDQCLKLFKAAIDAQIEFEKKYCTELLYSTDCVETRFELSLESALSHEIIS